MKTLYIVIPCYNEEEVIYETTRLLTEKMNSLMNQQFITKQSKVIYIDDGSKDKTWAIIEQTHQRDPIFTGLKLTRNQGHQNALLAGYMTAKEKADIVISMDADLQDDINAVDEMLEAYQKGNEIVYGVRSERKTDSFFKKYTAESFYHLMRFLGVDIIFNHADYRLMSQKALNDLAQYDEVNLFLRGIIPLIGYPSTTVYYERKERFAGVSKYPFKKMLYFAFEGITSFSIKPIRMILNVGILMLSISILIILYTLYRYYIGATVTGWAFMNISIWFIAGIQTLLLGIVGEYIGKIYSETKRRPRYFIEKFLD